jgi:hypothetical protein
VGFRASRGAEGTPQCASGGDSPKIFFDPQQRGNESFAEALLEQLKKTAALVSILSPSYFSSDWCPRELEVFFQACEQSGGLQVGEHGRLFKVVKLPVPEKERTPPLGRFLGYKFYTTTVSGTPREFWRGFGEDEKVQFCGAVERLADDLSKLLRQIRGLSPQRFSEVRKGQGFVYLAMTTSDLKDKREALRRDLEHLGYEVLPQRPLPETFSEAEAMVREQVAACHLSVHLIGGKYGSRPEESDLSYPELQNKLAAERSDLTRLVWVSAEQTDEPRQKDFIQRLQNTPELQGRMVPLKGSFEVLKNEVHRTLKQLSQPSPGVQVRSAEASTEYPEVYLLYDLQDRDQPALAQLRDILYENGCEVTTPLFDGDEAAKRLDHEETLRRCGGVLLFWGAGSESWRRSQFSEILKSAGRGRTGGAPLTLLYIASASPERDAFRSLRVSVVRQPPEGPSAALLADFLAKLRQGPPPEDAP